MARNHAPLTSDCATSVLVSILATVLLLILSATSAFAQSGVSQSATAPSKIASSESASSETAPSETAPSAPAAAAKGTARVTWPRATHALLRGAVLGAADYVLADTVITWAWKDAPTDTMTAVAGWVTRRPIAAGEFMHGPSVVRASVITMGSSVKVWWQDGNVRVTLTGTATNNAAMGAPVGVRIDKDRRLDGIAVGPNTVRLR